MIINERITAYHILRRFDSTKTRLDVLQEQELAKVKHSSQEIRHIKNLASGVLRNLSLLDFYSEQIYKGNFQKLLNKVKTLLRMGLYELQFMPHVPSHAAVNEYVKLARLFINDRTSKLVNAILRNFLRDKTKIDPKLKSDSIKDIAKLYSFPEWLINKWVGLWGHDFTKELCRSFNEFPTFNVRMNSRKINLEKFEQLLIESGIEFTKSDHFTGFYRVKKIAGLIESSLFEKGYCSIQDESAAIPVQLLNVQKDDIFLDVCAAPGGKFTQVLESGSRPKQAVAIDSDLSRLKRVKQNMKRLDLKGHLVAADARFLPFKIKFSKILIDAPCSGQGVIGKHPDIKWRRTEKEIQEFSEQQIQILEQTAGFLKKRGCLVYSTCSIDPNENKTVVESVLSKSSNNLKQKEMPEIFKLKEFTKNNAICTFPHLHNMDGSFAAHLGNEA